MKTRPSYYNDDREDIKVSRWEYFLDKPVDKKAAKSIRIALLNTPCGGFGDVVVTIKMMNYLKEWYNCHVKIITTHPGHFKKMNVKDRDLYQLKTKRGKQAEDCITTFAQKPSDKSFSKHAVYNLSGDRVSKKSLNYDLVMEIPVVDHSFYSDDIQRLLSSAKWYNTLSVSEYNGDYPPYDIPLGIGKNTGIKPVEDQLGILLEDLKGIKNPKIVKGPYAVAYLKGPTIVTPDKEDYNMEITMLGSSQPRNCITGFLELVADKYHKKHKSLSVLVPPWYSDRILKRSDYRKLVVKGISKWYPNITLVYDKGKEKVISEGKGNTLILRGDIFKNIIPRDKMIGVYKYSIGDILLTGDQSITDALSCCPNKNIWYELLGWKWQLAEQLEKHMPNKWYHSVKTSCGTLKAIHYHSHYQKMIKNYDFRKLGKVRMNAFVNMALCARTNKDFQNVLKTLENVKNKKTAIRKLQKL